MFIVLVDVDDSRLQVDLLVTAQVSWLALRVVSHSYQLGKLLLSQLLYCYDSTVKTV